MSKNHKDRKLALARLLQDLSDGSGDPSEFVSQLDEFENKELEEFLAAKKSLELLKKLQTKQGTHPTSDTLANGTLANVDVPSRIDRFEIQRLAARGGMASIFHAFDPVLQREVALKVPLPQLQNGNEELGERFRREGQAVALLSHPGIVPVFDAGEADGQSFISFQWIPGVNLATFLNQNSPANGPRLKVDECVVAVANLASAVAHAHAKGILHRDIKPANILVDETQESKPWHSRLLVTDFGLAKVFDRETTVLTNDDSLIGTPAYMSPELVKGDVEIDQRSDIYSLGVLLYELLIGKPPHKKQSYAATIRAIENEPIPRLQKLRQEIPADLEAICLKCLARNLDDRYASAYELESDLQRFMNNEPVTARRIGALGQLSRWSKRNPFLASSLCLAIAALTIGSATTTWLWRSSESNRQVAIQQKMKAIESEKNETAARLNAEEISAELSRQIAILQNLFEDLDPDHESFDGASLRERLGDRLVESTQLIASATRQEPQRSSLLRTFSRTLASLGRPNESYDAITNAISSSKGKLTRSQELLLLHQLAHSEATLENLEKSIKVMEPIIDEFLSNHDLSLVEKMRALNQLADAHYQLVWTFQSQESIVQSKKRFKQLAVLTDGVDVNELRILSLVANWRIASLEFLEDKSRKNLKNLEQLWSDFQNDPASNNSIYSAATIELIRLNQMAHQTERAIELAELAYEHASEHFGSTDSRTLRAIDGLIVALGSVNNSDTRKRLREILPEADILCKSVAEKLGAENGDAIIIRGNVATAWGIIGDLDKCIEIKNELLDISTETHGRSAPATQLTIAALAIAYQEQGDLASAEDCLNEFLDFLKEFPDREQPFWNAKRRVATNQLRLIKAMKLFSKGNSSSKQE